VALIDTARVLALIAAGESFTTEFKGEEREALADREIWETVVCLANADGGVILVGVENDGHVTGARPRHGVTTEPYRLEALIANRTVPKIATRVSLHAVDGRDVIAIEVEQGSDICATSDGRCLRRAMGMHGPECVPFLPYQHTSRRSDLRLIDYSAQLAESTSWDDLDPLEFERLRQMIRRLNGDRVLLGLDDRSLAQALQLVETCDGDLIPNIAGMLLLGREERLRRAVPTYEVAFQVLDDRGNVLVNDWFHGPILETLEAATQRFDARNPEQEVTIGLFVCRSQTTRRIHSAKRSTTLSCTVTTPVLEPSLSSSIRITSC
jgi:ATP-dependent DNA helicase RecG